MTLRYARSTDGSDSDSGLTWTLSKATLQGALTGSSGGDDIYLSQVHAQTQNTSLNLDLGGTLASAVRVICANDAAEPPTTVGTTASISTTGSSNISVNGFGYIEGVAFNAAVGGGYAPMNVCGNGVRQHYKNCAFNLVDGHPSSNITIGAGSGGANSDARLENTSFKFSNTAQILVAMNKVHILGGGIAAGGSTPATFLRVGSTSRGANILFDGFDFSNLAATFNLVNYIGETNGLVVFRNVKLPTSWSGLFMTVPIAGPDFRAEIYNTNYLRAEDCRGVLAGETVQVKTGGATTSWKITSTANAHEAAPFVSIEGEAQVSSVGSAKTISVDILHDSVTALTDSEVWLEIYYLGTASSTLSSNLADRRATSLTTSAAQSTSTATWVTTGMTNPNKQKLDVTFTPQVAGSVMFRVMLAKASKTIVVDPIATVA